MRHYVIHFWNQLPSHVEIDLEMLKQLDNNFYKTLEDIYMKIDSSVDQLKHLYAISTLNPLWLNKAMDGCYEEVKNVKEREAIKWKCKVKTQFQLIFLAKVSISFIIIIIQLYFTDLFLYF